METAPTIQWGYLIYLTVSSSASTSAPRRSAASATSTTTGASTSARGRPYTGVCELVEDVLEALALIDRYDIAERARAYTLTGGSVTSTVDGLAEADFYGRYAQAIEERFPAAGSARWSRRRCRRRTSSATRTTVITIYHPNYEVWDERLFQLISPGKERYVGRAEWHRRIFDAAEVFGARNVIPNFVAGVEMASPSASSRRGGDRLDHGGSRLLHEPRDHAALHHLVPRSRRRRSAGTTRTGRRSSTTSGCSRPTARPSTLGLKPPPGYGSRAPATPSSRSARSWTRSRRQAVTEEAVPA